eukprot:gene6698-5959_t
MASPAAAILHAWLWLIVACFSSARHGSVIAPGCAGGRRAVRGVITCAVR